MQPTSRRGVRGLVTAGVGLILAMSIPLTAGAAQNGFKTQQPAMIAPGAGAPAGTEIKPIITVGDTIGDYMFEAIPDGISYWKSAKNQATVLVNHETSTVPFPYVAAGPTTANSFNDFANSEVSKLVIRKGGQILSAEKVIDTWDGYHRFCSSFLATTDGFEDRPMLFTNEEGIDWVFEDVVEVNGVPLGWNNEESIEGDAGAREIGAVVAYDVNADDHRPIWGMGRHNHENSLAVPGYGSPFILSGDDAFVSSPAQSQVYAYGAADADAVWADEGTLYAFVPDNAAINDYYDFPIGSAMSITGDFIEVPREIATGKNDDGTDMMAGDVPEFADDGTFLGGPYPLPPADGTWQRGLGLATGVDGPQWVLEHWSDLNNVFQFTRIEDMAFDKRPGMSTTSSTSSTPVAVRRAQAATPSPRRTAGSGRWSSTRLNPLEVDSLSILIEGDDNPVKTLGEIHQPDNIESTVERAPHHRGPRQQPAVRAGGQGLPNATTARLMHYRFSTGAITAVLKVDQSADEGPTDEDAPTSPGNWGAWETSGIIDVSSVFGPNKFMIDVQAHSLYVDIDTTSAPDNLAPAGPDWTYKREGGQLLLVTHPGRLTGNARASRGTHSDSERPGVQPGLSLVPAGAAGIAAPPTIRYVTPQLEATLKKLPTRPGVYLLKDARGQVLYVGKAQNLRNRVRSYWQKEVPTGSGSRSSGRPSTGSSTSRYTITDSVGEALLLEGNLVKRFQPPVQRPAQGRQELPVHQDHARRRLPADRADAEAAERREPLFRPVLVRLERRRGDEPRPAAVPVPDVHDRHQGRRAGAPAPLPAVPHQALPGPVHRGDLEGRVPRRHRAGRAVPRGPPGVARAGAPRRHEAGVRSAGLRARGDRAGQDQGGRADDGEPEDGRVRAHRPGPARARPARQPGGGPALRHPRRQGPRARRLPARHAPRRDRRRGRLGLPAPVLRPGHEHPAGDRDPDGPAGRRGPGAVPVARPARGRWRRGDTNGWPARTARRT